LTGIPRHAYAQAMISHDDLETAQRIVYQAMPPTPQYAWPLLAQEIGTEVWLKHENHTPTGAFKIRGGLVRMALCRERGETQGVISATRGNHGQSLAVAGKRNGIPVTIVAPIGNSREKNAAMRAQGAELIETGKDFDEAVEAARRIAAERGLTMMPSFHRELVMGVATYAHELIRAAGELDAVYVPIGLGSGICGVISVRDLLAYKTEIIGVVAKKAPAYALSFAQGRPVPTNSADTFADGVAVRNPHPEALAVIKKGATRIVEIAEDEFAEGIRLLYRTTHNLAEGAGAAAVAAILKERSRLQGKRVAAVLTGGNIDMALFAEVLAGRTPYA
jgi:threonine dehydratase